jgi:hypothetical protein
MTNGDGKPGTALVTGAGGGIGRELAVLLARDGYDLVVVARGREALETLAGELRGLGRTVAVLPADLARPGAAQALFDEVMRLGLVIDVLVNNAGIGTHGAFHDIATDKDLELLELNVVSLAVLTKLFVREMVARKRGRVLNVASLAAFQPGPYMAAYCASKAFVLSLSEAVASELAGTGVTVSALCPGPVPTGFQQRAGNQRTRLNRGPTMDARTVAAIGYRGLQRGQPVILPGLRTKLLAFATRLGPRRVVTSIAKLLMRPES